MCPFYCFETKDLISHLIKRHRNAPNFAVHCSSPGCGATFRNIVSFRSHCFRKHFMEGHVENELWQNHWDKNKKGRTLYSIKPTVSLTHTLPKTTRESEVILLKLRSGYIATNKLLCKIGKKSSKECETCHVVDDVNHYLLMCNKHTTERKDLFDDLIKSGVTDYSLKNLLTGHSSTFVPVCKYLKSTGMWFNKRDT